ncbi:hypothetical protein G7008_20540 [Pseudomonas psychrotolerans]|uniref:hypothetical protein n=1 Tax=Pseudomonas oryzihabitans TaxID=47885 RepID=UPI0015E2CBA2|nr:hypothetical protein [Pseudomonas psychrotolerans]EIO9964684.1 hypothetical protein [Listeria monocytogenes]MBA1182886.1 hypothetical protein [Pseudomonas psychrotolerans]MBA1210715.1 hypothetical protein [Pseudomonas psychrotolerans]
MSAHEVCLDTQEQISLHKAVRTAGHEPTDASGNASPALAHFRQSALEYKSQHGSLEGWTPGPAKPARTLGAELARIEQDARRARREAIKAAGVQTRYLSLAEAEHVIRGALNACMDDKPPKATALLREAGVSPKDAAKLASRGSPHIVRVWNETRQHPNREVMHMTKVMTRRHERNIQSGSLANAVEGIYYSAAHARDRQKLADHEQRIKEMEARLAALEAGDNWKAIAERMRAEGASHNAIAQAIGKTRDAVAGYLRRCKQ